jgi:riboflavin synthase
MFTGIVQMVGRIAAVTPRGDGARIAVDTGVPSQSDVAVGDSVAVAGCCLTVVAIEGATLAFDISAETMRVTHGLDRSGDVNLELALRLSDRLGGHLMTGHVDGVGTVRAFAAVPGDDNGSVRLEVEAPAELARFIAPKGSIAVDGVSLTVNEVRHLCRQPHPAYTGGDDPQGARARRARQPRSRSRRALRGAPGRSNGTGRMKETPWT